MSKVKYMKNYTDIEIINRYLQRYKASKQSVKMRKSCLNYFFDKKYFGYKDHIFDLNKHDLVDYFDWLNNLGTISLQTKKNKWRILKSFLNFTMEYYDDFLIKIPSKTIQWRINHKKSKSNKNIFMTTEEIKQILNHLELNNAKHYLIFRIFAETGMRKGELINIEYPNVNLEKRYIRVMGKTGEKIYYISKNLREKLRIYIEERKLMNVNSNTLFLTTHEQKYNLRFFNLLLKQVCKILKIKKNITCHTFRKSLNNFREEMGCDPEKRMILLNHAVPGVNFDSYVQKDYQKFLGYYDIWNPYLQKGIKI